jgi:dipeptidyl aminopeptidase/acylaminoacyl peptidase
MIHKLPRAWLALLLLAPFAAAAQKSAADYTVEQFFRRADYQNMTLAPNGERLAATIPYKGRANLVVIDLNKRTRNLISSFETMDVGSFYWVSNDRLCMRVAETQDVSGAFNYRGTYCVDADGQNLRDFTKLGAGMRPIATIAGDSSSVIVQFAERSRDSQDAFRLDTKSGKYELLTRNSPGDVTTWIVDSDHVPRVAVSDEERKGKARQHRVIWYRDNMEAKWEKLFDYELLAQLPLGEYFEPIAFDYDKTTLYVSGRPAGRDRAAIYKYDTKTRKLGELMFEDPNVDVEGGLMFSRAQKKLLGVRYQGAKPVVRWMDDDLHRIQDSVDATFKDTINEIRLPTDSMERALVFASSDRNPGEYFLFDRKRNGVEELVKTREWLDPKLMAERRFIKYTARDGRVIPAYVTIPRGGEAKNLPLIVNIHGGPQVRGYRFESWGRWPHAEFFASRGYVVLEPEPRGSTGYGFELWKAGWKQWGGTAQDDITDGALHLAKEGLVDKDRMCVMGGSYGGYASAMAVVKDPDLWKCSAPFVAVTDLFLFKEVTYSDIAQVSDYFETDYLTLVGDPRTDKEAMDRASPARHGDRVKVPVFLTMGGADVRVPEVHGAAFYAAVQKGGAPIEYKVYTGEGHGYNKQENVVDFYKRLEKFFAQNIGKK